MCSDVVHCVDVAKNYDSYKGGYLAKSAIFVPLPFPQFFSYINTMYLKRTHFSYKIRIFKKNTGT